MLNTIVLKISTTFQHQHFDRTEPKTITDLFNAASDGRQNGGEWVSLWSISNARLKAVPEDQRGQDEGSPNQLPRRQIPWFWILDSAKGKRGVDRARSAAQEVP